jgi:NodT family efflux transporter outer membrane factor (OMF) lipoprotein
MGRGAAAVGFLVLAACAVGPEYRRPEDGLHPFGASARSAIEPSQATGAEPDHWWAGYGDPLLTRLVEKSRSANLSLSASMARVQAARALARRSGAQLLPAFGLDASAARTHGSLESPVGRIAAALPGFDRNQSTYDIGASASWEIDLFGGLRRARQAASAQFAAAEAAEVGVRIAVSADTAAAYLKIRGLQARRGLLIEQISVSQQAFELISRQFRVGVANVGDLSAAEAALVQLQASLEPLELELVVEANRLDVLTGEQPGTWMPLLAEQADIPRLPDIPGPGSVADVLRRRPDVRAAERVLAGSTARIGQSLAEYYPKFSVAGLAGPMAASTGSLMTSGTFQTEAIAGLRWRLFDFGRVNAEVAVAKAQRAEALADYRSAVLRAAEDVENAFATLARLQSLQSRMEERVDAINRSLRAAHASRLAGAESRLSELAVELRLLQAKSDLAHARQDCALASVGTFRAIGGGW